MFTASRSSRANRAHVRPAFAGHDDRAVFPLHAVALACLVASAVPSVALAGPEGGTVAAGSAQIARGGTLMQVTQQSNRAVIDWRSYSVGANEAVVYRQPDASAVTLNRVTGADASTILGRISANGRVYVVNPNGILFGSTAQVDVGALVASTANISNANFMAGVDRFDQPGNPEAKVVNQGTIRIADGGLAALVGRQVSNGGFIVANLGKVALAAGDAFVLDVAGDRLIHFILDASLLERVQDAQGRPLIARVDNTGNVQAGGGRVQLSAATVSALLDNVINVGGDIRATAVGASGGVISLSGNATTAVELGGVIQAGGSGSRIQASGRDVTLASGAQVDLSLGANLTLAAARNVSIDSSINALRAAGTAGVQAGGSLTATAGNDLSVAANQVIALNDGALALTATAGQLRTGAGSLLQSGAAAATLRGGAGVTVGRVLASGAVDIASSAGGVTLGQAVLAPSANQAVPAASLTVDARDAVTLNGAYAQGAISITSTAGGVSLGPSTLQSNASGIVVNAAAGRLDAAAGSALLAAGTIDLAARDGMGLQTIVTPGSVALRSAAGGVTVASAIAGTPGQTLTQQGVGASGLRVEAAGAVALSGARLGRGGLTVTGPGGSGGAASFTLAGGSVRSEGDVAITTIGDITTGPFVSSDGRIAMNAAGGNLIVGDSGAAALSAGATGIDLRAGGTLALNGDLQTSNGPISLNAGRVVALVTAPGQNPVSIDAVIDAGTNAVTSNVTIVSNGGAGAGGVMLGGIRAAGLIDVSSAQGDIVLASPLGGSNTGYLNYADGYLGDLDPSKRPDVGRLRVTASNGSVELNGLNLDGLADPYVSGNGLDVQAARLVISNSRIAVNKGPIAIAAGSTQATDGVYLGDSVFSRGWDSTGGNARREDAGQTTDDVKKAYDIRVSGGRLVLFDNTDQTASLTGMFRITPAVGGTVYTDVLGYLVDAKTGLRLTPAQRARVDCSGSGLSCSSPVVVVSNVDANGRYIDNNGVWTNPELVVGEAVRRNVASIEIANNAANYDRNTLASSTQTAEALRSALVPHNADGTTPSITVNVSELSGSTMTGPTSAAAGSGRHTIAEAAASSRRSLSTTDSYSPNEGGLAVSTKGILLKLLSFDAPIGAPSDTSTVVWPSGVAFGNQTTDPKAEGRSDGGNTLFPDLRNGSTSYVTSPVRGLFDVVLVNGGSVKIEYSTGTNLSRIPISAYLAGPLTLEMRQLAGDLSGWVQLLGPRLTSAQMTQFEALRTSVPAGATNITVSWADSNAATYVLVGNYASVRGLNSAALRIGTAGSASSIDLNGSVLSTSRDGVTSDVPLRVSGSLAPKLFELSEAKYQQASGQTSLRAYGTGGGGGSNYPAPVYSVGSVIVESSSNGNYPALEAGTRMIVYDGVLESQAGRGQADSGGGAYVPGLSGTSGSRNNSTTAFSSVGAGTGALSGTSGAGATASAATATAADGLRIAIQPPSGDLGSVPVISDSGSVSLVVSSAAERASEDALVSNVGVVDEPGDSSAAIQYALAPAAQADFGRSSAVAGAVSNVFARSYRVASSPDNVVCAPGAVESGRSAKRGAAPNGTDAGKTKDGGSRECR